MTSNVETVAAIYAAFGRGDVDAILDQLADDVAWDEGIRPTDVAYLAPGRGRDHAAAFFGHLAATVEFTHFAPGPLCDGGDVVMVPVDEAGRIVGGGEIPLDRVAHEWRFGPDGKVVGFRHIADLAQHERAAAGVTAGLTGQTLHAVGDEIEVLLAGVEGEVFRLRGPEGSGPPPHAHPWRESYWGIEGDVHVQIGSDQLALTPGAFVTIPAGTVHTFRITSPTASFLLLTSGHRAARFFADMAANVPPGPPDDESMPALIDVARRNGLTSPLFD
jgi:quercetin dioxygenase-like cupin family protein